MIRMVIAQIDLRLSNNFTCCLVQSRCGEIRKRDIKQPVCGQFQRCYIEIDPEVEENGMESHHTSLVG